MIRRTRGEKIFNVFNVTILGVVALMALYPFVYTISMSLSSAAEAMRSGLHLYPRDISLTSFEMVLANPEIAGLPNWVIALVAAGGLAAALSTAAGLLLVVSTSVSHDLLRKWLKPDLSEKQELLVARISAGAAVCVAGYLGIHPPGFVAEVVAFAFGLAAASFFPAILMGIFMKRMNREGAIAGMVVGLVFTASYIIYFRFLHPELDSAENWWWGISPKGIGTVGMLFNFMVAGIVRSFTSDPPADVMKMVEDIRVPEQRAV